MWIVMCLQWQNLLLPNNNFTLTSRYRSHLNCVCTQAAVQPDNFHRRWKPPNNRAIGVLTKWISLCRGVIEKKFLAVNDVRCDWQTKNYLAWNVSYCDYNRSPDPCLICILTLPRIHSKQKALDHCWLVASNESQILARTGQFLASPPMFLFFYTLCCK